MKKFDVIIIGGGHNGLVASSYLAKKGKKVLVIEKNEHVGGLAEYANSLNFISPIIKKELPSDFYKAVKNFKIRGSSGKLNIALDDLPIWKSIPEGDPAGTGDLHITQNIEEMEGAYDDWKDGKWSQFPYVDMCIPSINDPTMAPQGKHYMSVFIQYVPYNLAD